MKSYKQYMMEADEQKLIKKMDKIRKTLVNHARRRGSTVYSRKSEDLIYRYEETSEELKDAGILLSNFYNNPENYISQGFHDPESIRLSTIVITETEIINDNPLITDINSSNISEYINKYLYDNFHNKGTRC